MNYIQQYHDYIDKYPNRIPKTIKQRVPLDKKMMEKYTFQEKFVTSCINWIGYYCKLVDGENSGEPFIMTLPQKYAVSVIFGFWGDVKTMEFNELGEHTGFTVKFQRITKEALMMVASGFGKTTFVAAINTLILNVDSLFKDPKIFIGSNAHAQSRLCFDTTMKMIKLTEFVDNFNFRPSLSEIENKENNGAMRAMSSKGDNHEGIVPAVIILDEIHAMKTGQYANDLKKSTKRDDMLVFEITTQGRVRGGYLDNKLEVARKTLRGDVVDDSKQYFIWENESIDEVFEAYNNNNIDILFKSNPNLGIAQSPNILLQKIKDMLDDPSLRPATLTKNFNIPQNPASLYYSNEEIKSIEFDENYFYNKPVFIGLDVANTRRPNNDLTALTFCAIDPNTSERRHLDYFFLPKWYLDKEEKKQDMIFEKTNIDGVDYQYYIDRGDVILIDDVEIRQEHIINFIDEIIGMYNLNVFKFGIDPNRAELIIQHFNGALNDSRFCLNYLSEQTKFNTPVIETSKRLRGDQKVFTNNKLTEIHFANTMAKFNSNNYITFINNQSERKDMAIAHMAAYSAYNVWSMQKNKEGQLNNEMLKKIYARFEDEA